MGIEVRHITKSFGSFVALRDVSVRFAAGALTALVGPAGSGKTSLLRIIAGLDSADAGTGLLDGAKPALAERDDPSSCAARAGNRLAD